MSDASNHQNGRLTADQLVHSFGEEVMKTQDLLGLLKEIERTRPAAVCGKVLNGDLAVKCDTCSMDAFAIYCLDCFDEKEHVGHQYQIKKAQGNCDCGSRFSIKEDHFCKRHFGSHKSKTVAEQADVCDLKKLGAWVQSLFNGYLAALRAKDDAQCDAYVEAIKRIFFTHSIDVFKRVITNYFFSPHGKCGPEDIIADRLPMEMLCPHVDIGKMLADFANGNSIDEYYNIALFMYLEKMSGAAPHSKRLTEHLANDQIMEPLFRSLLIFCFYLQFPDLKEQAVTPIRDVWKGIQDPTQEVVGEVILAAKIDLGRPAWRAAPVQLCSNVHMDQLHSLLFASSELRQFLDAQIEITRPASLTCYQQLDTTVLEQMVKRGLESFALIKGSEATLEYVRDNTQHCVEILKKLPKLAYDTTRAIAMIFSNMKYVLLPEIYCSTNIHYLAMVLDNPMTCLQFLQVPFMRSYMCLPRRRDRPCIEDESDIINTLHMTLYDFTKQFNFAWTGYLAAYVGTQFDQNLDLYSEIARNNTPICEAQIEKRPEMYRSVIENVGTIACYLMLAQTLYDINHYMYSPNARYPQVPVGFGLHVASPVISSDRDGVDQLHLIFNPYCMYLSFVLSAHQQHHATGSEPLDAASYLQELLAKIPFTSQLPKYNSYTLQAMLIRMLVTNALWHTDSFARLGQAQGRLAALYAPPETFSGCDLYFVFHLLQLLALKAPPAEFLFQMFEAYGFVDSQTGEYADRFTPQAQEDAPRMYGLLIKLISHLWLLAASDVSFGTPAELKLRFAMKVFMLTANPKEKEFEDFFDEIGFFNATENRRLLEPFVERVQPNFVDSDIYKSEQQIAYMRLNAQGLRQCSCFDPFLYEASQFLSFFQQYAEAIKQPQLLPHDAAADPHFKELAAQIVQYRPFQMAMGDAIQRFLDHKQATGESQTDFVIMCCALQFMRRTLGDDIKVGTAQQKLGDLHAKLLTNKSTTPAMLLLLENKQVTAEKKQGISLKDRLARLESKQRGDEKQLMEMQAGPESPNTAQQQTPDSVSRFITQVKEIAEFDSSCAVCQDYDTDDAMMQYSNFISDKILAQQVTEDQALIKPLKVVDALSNDWEVLTSYDPLRTNYPNIILHTCSHRVHQKCSKAFQTCPICRQNTNILLPIVGGANFDLQVHLNFLQRALGNTCQDSDDFAKCKTALEKIRMGVTVGVGMRAQADLSNERVAAIFGDVWGSLELSMKQLVTLYAYFAFSNMAQFVVRCLKDEVSPQDTKNRMYRDAVSCSASVLFMVFDLVQYMLQNKIAPSFFEELYANQERSDIQNIILGAGCGFNSAIDLLPRWLQPITKDSFRVMWGMHFSFETMQEIAQQHDSNIAELQSSQFKYLYSEDIADPAKFYYMLRFMRRQKELAGLACPSFQKPYGRPFFARKFDAHQLFSQNRNFLTLVRKLNQARCEKCDGPSHAICLHCGEQLCAKCISSEQIESHRLTCELDPVWFFFERNLLLFCSNDEKVVFNGAPYLSDAQEDDCQRIKRVPLYLSGGLLSAYQRHILWRLDYKNDLSKGIPFGALIPIVQRWYAATRE